MSDLPGQQQDTLVLSHAGNLIQQQSRVFTNLEQEIILTTEDKIRICLMRHISRMEQKWRWLTPLGIALTIGIIFPTSTFHDFLLPAETWQAIFVVSGAISVGWLVTAAVQAVRSPSIDDVVAEIKRDRISTGTFDSSAVFSAQQTFTQTSLSQEVDVRAQ